MGHHSPSVAIIVDSCGFIGPLLKFPPQRGNPTPAQGSALGTPATAKKALKGRANLDLGRPCRALWRFAFDIPGRVPRAALKLPCWGAMPELGSRDVGLEILPDSTGRRRNSTDVRLESDERAGEVEELLESAVEIAGEPKTEPEHSKDEQASDEHPCPKPVRGGLQKLEAH